MPDEEARLKILQVHTKRMPLAKDVDLKKLAKVTEGYSGADLENLCREAGMEAIRENINAKVVTMEHFRRAMNNVKPSLRKEFTERMERFKESAATMYG